MHDKYDAFKKLLEEHLEKQLQEKFAEDLAPETGNKFPIESAISDVDFEEVNPVEVPANTYTPTDYSSALIVDHCNPECSVLHISLGIHEERAKELGDLITTCMKRHTLLPDIFVEVSSRVMHVNELVFVTFLMGHNYKQNK